MSRAPRATSHGLLALAVITGCSFAGAATGMSRNEYRVERDKLQAAYKMQSDGCQRAQGRARDICKVEAKGNSEVARAELEARRQATPKHDDKVKTEKAAAAYRLATEKCGDLAGNAKDVCRKDAKASYVAATGEARLSRASVNDGLYSRKAVHERKDVREDTADAEFAAARQRCDALAREPKASCLADARKTFGKL
jgi:hypothetical protein